MTCGYFSVSAMRSCVRPASATTWPSTFARLCGGKIVSQECVQLLAVLRHAGRGGDPDNALAREARKIRIEQSGQDLAYAVGAEVEAEHAVAVAHAAIVADDRGHHELVAEIVRVGVRDRRAGIRKARALRFHDCADRPWRHALPAVVAIHGVVAAADRRDRNGSRQRRQQPRNVLARGSRRRVAAVGESMHDSRHARLRQNFRQRRGVVLVRMHAARRDQADEVAGAAALAQPLDQALQRRRALDLAVGDGIGDARQVLHHQAPGADIEMADLGIAHLPRQAGRHPCPTYAGRRAGRSPTGGRRSACGPGGRRCRRGPRASPSRPGPPASPDGVSASAFPCGSLPSMKLRSPAVKARRFDDAFVGLRRHRQPVTPRGNAAIAPNLAPDRKKARGCPGLFVSRCRLGISTWRRPDRRRNDS